MNTSHIERLANALADFNTTRSSDIFVVNFGGHYHDSADDTEKFKREVGALLMDMAELGESATVIWRLVHVLVCALLPLKVVTLVQGLTSPLFRKSPCWTLFCIGNSASRLSYLASCMLRFKVVVMTDFGPTIAYRLRTTTLLLMFPCRFCDFSRPVFCLTWFRFYSIREIAPTHFPSINASFENFDQLPGKEKEGAFCTGTPPELYPRNAVSPSFCRLDIMIACRES